MRSRYFLLEYHAELTCIFTPFYNNGIRFECYSPELITIKPDWDSFQYAFFWFANGKASNFSLKHTQEAIPSASQYLKEYTRVKVKTNTGHSWEHKTYAGAFCLLQFQIGTSQPGFQSFAEYVNANQNEKYTIKLSFS